MLEYNPDEIISAYTTNAEMEDQAEKGTSFRTEIPREFIQKYIKDSDVVLDAGGGVGINAIMMAERCQSVTLLDITPKILEYASSNIRQAGYEEKITILTGDITDLSQFTDDLFSFLVCVGDSISYVGEARFRAMKELVRVVQKGSILIIGCDSKWGFLRMNLLDGNLNEALSILDSGETTCGMGPRTHLYTVQEMTDLLTDNGCEILEIVGTPPHSAAYDYGNFTGNRWDELKELEIELCSQPEVLGAGLHLMFVARKK